MNGRMYDPVQGRFLSPDNYIQDPFNTQNYNRYGYVLNNPLMYTDVSGECAECVVGIVAGIAALGILIAKAIWGDNNDNPWNAPVGESGSPPSAPINNENNSNVASSIWPPSQGIPEWKYDLPNGILQFGYRGDGNFSKLAYSLSPDDYFDRETGEYLGKGGTDEIRFISKEDWTSGNLNKYSTYTSNVDTEANVYSYYLNAFDLAPKGADEVIFKGDLRDAWKTSYKKIEGKQIITTHFSSGSIGSDIRTKFDIVNIIIHETNSHGSDWLKFKTYDGDDPGTFWNWEKRALNNQINHWSWPKTSFGIKQIMYDAYGKQPYVLPANKRYKYFGKYGVK